MGKREPVKRRAAFQDFSPSKGPVHMENSNRPVTLLEHRGLESRDAYRRQQIVYLSLPHENGRRIPFSAVQARRRIP